MTDLLTETYPKTINNIMLQYFRYWKEHAEILSLLKNSECEYQLNKHYNRLMMNTLDLLKENFKNYSENEFTLIKSFIIGGLLNYKLSWLEQDYKQTPEEMATLICRLIGHPC